MAIAKQAAFPLGADGELIELENHRQTQRRNRDMRDDNRGRVKGTKSDQKTTILNLLAASKATSSPFFHAFNMKNLQGGCRTV